MKRVTFDKLKAAEFKTLVEQFTDNGKLDTIPELMQRVSEIPEAADNSDIDEIFGDSSSSSSSGETAGPSTDNID